MLSPLWQRIGIAIGVALGGLCWVGILPSLQSPSGTGGLVLFNAPSVSTAVLLVIVAGIPSVVLGTLLSTVGWFTAGVAVLAGSLMVLAYVGGPTMGWIQRAMLPGDYWQLIAEMLLWQILLLLAIGLIYRFRPMVHGHIPALLRPEPAWKTSLSIPGSNELLAALISSGVALVLAFLLIRTGSPKQVMASLVISFALGAGIGQTMMPNTNPIAIFVSPTVVAVISYLLVLMRFDDPNALISALFAGSEPGTSLMSIFPGSALALPIHYASAGLLGCCIGVGIVRAAADQSERPTAASEHTLA